MASEVEYTDEFAVWWATLDEKVQDDIASVVGLLQMHGTTLDYPYSSAVKGGKSGKLRELRVQSRGKPIRIFYYFNDQRIALLLHGGRKTDSKWYKKNIQIAEKLLNNAEDELRQKGENNE